ncbi:MAG TPA: adenosylcobinamide-GDP ribazoletransferase [Baekduia sp.]|nr:adenosylcobinamide-GDP ribazoletransferase [Baekduia sp.]
MSGGTPLTGAAATADRAGSLLDGARLAISFLTVIPAGGSASGTAWLSRAAPWFPVVGALVGGGAAGVVLLADVAGLSHAVGGALALVFGIVVTRGLHEDGLADTADGLGVHGTRERRLAAMKDSAVGAHGALAIACALLLGALALAALDAGHAARALVAAHVLSRTAMVVVAAALPNARAHEGLGRSLAVSPVVALLATVPSVVGVLAVCGVADGTLTLGVAALTTLAALAIQHRAFGGRTGDTLGATGKLVEVAALVALSGAWAS